MLEDVTGSLPATVWCIILFWRSTNNEHVVTSFGTGNVSFPYSISIILHRSFAYVCITVCRGIAVAWGAQVLDRSKEKVRYSRISRTQTLFAWFAFLDFYRFLSRSLEAIIVVNSPSHTESLYVTFFGVLRQGRGKATSHLDQLDQLELSAAKAFSTSFCSIL